MSDSIQKSYRIAHNHQITQDDIDDIDDMNDSDDLLYHIDSGYHASQCSQEVNSMSWLYIRMI